LYEQCASPGSAFCGSVGTYALAAQGAYRRIDGSEVNVESAESRRSLRDQGWSVTTAPATTSQSQQSASNGWLVASKRDPDGKTTYMVSIEGSKDTADWRDNLDARGRSVSLGAPDSVRGCTSRSGCQQVHGGFVDHANRLLADPDFKRQLDAAALDPNGKMVFVGHSLGGATATVLAGQVAAADPTGAKKVEVVTFGAPPALYGDSFEKSLKDRIAVRNVVNPDDPVTTIPTVAGLKRPGEDYYILPQEPPRMATYIPLPGPTGMVTGGDIVGAALRQHDMNKYLDAATRVQQQSANLILLDDIRKDLSSSTQSIKDSLKSGSQQILPTTSTGTASSVDEYKNQAREATSNALIRNLEAQAEARSAAAAAAADEEPSPQTSGGSSGSGRTNSGQSRSGYVPPSSYTVRRGTSGGHQVRSTGASQPTYRSDKQGTW
jgi:pimeloyl-ACP methyl ester carboxylesterase